MQTEKWLYALLLRMLYNAPDYVSYSTGFHISYSNILLFMKDFYTYFSAEQIIGLLCKLRIKHAKQRHKVHLMRDISLHKSTLDNFKSKSICPSALAELLPPRRSWYRLNETDRKKYRSSTDINIEALRRTILTMHIKVTQEAFPAPAWYNILSAFINKIQDIINLKVPYSIQKPTIIAIKKENKFNCRKFRPISQYSLEDGIIIGQTAKYLTYVFDEQLLDCAYAFRAVKKGCKIKTHHDAVDSILLYKKHHQGKNIFAAECDIKKFFDCVQHEHIKIIFSEFVNRAKKYHNSYDHRASTFFYQYLDSYSFNHDVFPLKNTCYFIDIGAAGGEFEWPEEKLRKEFYGDKINEFKIGVPQGGALSGLISNLLLHNVDEQVLSERLDKEIEYLRFCDDMILLSISRNTCNEALLRYTRAIKENFLLIHEPKDIDVYGKKFYNSDVSKSKKPFRWAPPSKSETSSPWISFVGYQIRHDGAIRVRKKSIQKEVKKQEKETREVLKSIRSKDIFNVNINSRKSLKQQLIALESRFIAMSVGKRKIYNYKTFSPSMCWTNGFKRLSLNAISASQLRLLDSRRNRQLFIVKKTLGPLIKKAESAGKKNIPTKYLGFPFSYYGSFYKK